MSIIIKKLSIILSISAVSICALWSMNVISQRKNDMLLEKKIASMSVKEKIGQMIIIGINSKTIEASLQKRLRLIKPGGIILFRRALQSQKQTRRLIKHLQKTVIEAQGLPLFVAVDQEGGKVNRVGLGFTHTPGNMAISVTGQEKYARIAGEINGMELRSLGINLNLAPCVDVLNVATNEVIGTRSFGSEMLPVSQFANAYFNGLRKYGVLGCAKHFPNHGAVEEDSHAVLPTSDLKQEDIIQSLLPYRTLINNNIDMVMPAHISWTDLDDNNLPGTFSKKMIIGLLRKKLGFSGVVISDAIEMQAISESFSYADAAVNFINAGGDIILIGTHSAAAQEIVNGIYAAVQDGRISEPRIDESLTRILTLKNKIYRNFSMTDDAHFLDDSVLSENKRMAQLMAEKSIRRYGHWGHMPVITEDSKVLMVSSSRQWNNIAHDSFKEAGFFKIPRNPLNSFGKVKRKLEKMVQKENPTLVALVCENKKQSEFYKKLLKQLNNKFPRIVIFSEDLSCLNQEYYKQFPVIVLWGPSPFSRQAALKEILLSSSN